MHCDKISENSERNTNKMSFNTEKCSEMINPFKNSPRICVCYAFSTLIRVVVLNSTVPMGPQNNFSLLFQNIFNIS